MARIPDLNDVVKCCRCGANFVRRSGEYMCMRKGIPYFICGDCNRLFEKYYAHKLQNDGASFLNWDDVFFNSFLKRSKDIFIFR